MLLNHFQSGRFHGEDTAKERKGREKFKYKAAASLI